MNYDFIIKHNSTSIVLFFAGWGMDSNPFKSIHLDCDFMVIYDYNNFQFDTSILAPYSNIYIFAWSFGVYSAAQFIETNNSLPICLKIAINGTMTPIDDEKGIPTGIFDGTYNNLSIQNIQKFNRRICKDNSQYELLNINKPQRSLESLKDELGAMKINSLRHPISTKIHWNTVIIGQNDRIFPYKNQVKAWDNNCDTIYKTDDAHLPAKIGDIIINNIINKELLKKRFTKVLTIYDQNATRQKEISIKLHNLWKAIDYRKHSSVLEIGCGTGFLTNLYINDIQPKRLVLNDLCNIPSSFIKDKVNYTFIAGDAEKLTFTGGGKFDYIVSTSVIQWLENITTFFHKLSNMLNPNGLIAISTFGKENMKEIKQASGNSLHYYDSESLKSILMPYFDIISISEDIDTLHFDSPTDVIRHIKSTGVNSIPNTKLWTKNAMQEFINKYPCDEHGAPLTYNPIYIIGRLKTNL
ncbi:MAG: malonyl-ACP O-methyltransferase BioC [Muribaculaceae bacterium]|nr:malonyl-ACP O-methyltransferase BioC [Muribaculaceae bacterium]